MFHKLYGRLVEAGTKALSTSAQSQSTSLELRQRTSPDKQAILDVLKNYTDNSSYGFLGQSRAEKLKSKIDALEIECEQIGEIIPIPADADKKTKEEIQDRNDLILNKREYQIKLKLAEMLKLELMSPEFVNSIDLGFTSIEFGSKELRFALIRLYLQQFSVDDMQGKEEIIVKGALDFIQKQRANDKEIALRALEKKKRYELERLFAERLNPDLDFDHPNQRHKSPFSGEDVKACKYFELLTTDHNIYNEEDINRFQEMIFGKNGIDSNNSEANKKKYPNEYFYYRLYRAVNFIDRQKREKFKKLVADYAALRDEVYAEINNDSDLVKKRFNEITNNSELPQMKVKAARIAEAKKLVLAFFGKRPEEVEKLISEHYKAIKLVMIDRQPKDLIQKKQNDALPAAQMNGEEPPLERIDFYNNAFMVDFIRDVCGYLDYHEGVIFANEGLERAVRIYLDLSLKRKEEFETKNKTDLQTSLRKVVKQIGELSERVHTYKAKIKAEPYNEDVEQIKASILVLTEEIKALRREERAYLEQIQSSSKREYGNYIKKLIREREYLTTSKELRYLLIKQFNKHFLDEKSHMAQIFGVIDDYIEFAKDDEINDKMVGIERAQELAYKYFIYSEVEEDILNWLAHDIYTKINDSTSKALLMILKVKYKEITGERKPKLSFAGHLRCMLNQYQFHYLLRSEKIIKYPEIGEKGDKAKVDILLERLRNFIPDADKSEKENNDQLCDIIIENFIRTFIDSSIKGDNSSAGNKLYLAVCDHVYRYLSGNKKVSIDYAIQGTTEQRETRDAVLNLWAKYKTSFVKTRNRPVEAAEARSSASSWPNLFAGINTSSVIEDMVEGLKAWGSMAGPQSGLSHPDTYISFGLGHSPKDN